MQSTPLRFIQTLAALAGAVSPLFFATSASAQLVDAGRRGSLVFDDLSGFRASTVGGVGYAGPLGFSVQSVNEANFDVNANTTTTHYTNFWFAPSIDVFVIDHLSLGGLIEVAITSTSVDNYTANTGTTVSTSLPTTTNLTFLPRVGWLFDVTKRFGIWPRLGLGWAETQTAQSSTVAGVNTSTGDRVESFILDVDCGFVFRVTNEWFIRAAPEFTWGPGSHSLTAGNTETSASATLTSFSLAGGFGYMWNR